MRSPLGNFWYAIRMTVLLPLPLLELVEEVEQASHRPASGAPEPPPPHY